MSELKFLVRVSPELPEGLTPCAEIGQRQQQAMLSGVMRNQMSRSPV